jgi:hypothetical protein
LKIGRVQNGEIDTEFVTDTEFRTSPMFYITSRTDSGIDLPDLVVTDEKVLGKYGSDLTANFADIRAHGANAFFQKDNVSTRSEYSLCTCTTGYIWISVDLLHATTDSSGFAEAEVQIGTYALKAKAITTVEIPFRYKFANLFWRKNEDGEIALVCSTVLGKYLRYRMIGRQYEQAMDHAIQETEKELEGKVNISAFKDFRLLLKQVCVNAPLPPTSNVSLISRSMITQRWQAWRETSTLRKRYFFPKRIIRCLKPSRYDSVDLLSECFMALAQKKPQPPVVSTAEIV